MLKINEMADGLQFEEEKHVYMRNGIVLPSVTEILSPFVNFDSVPTLALELAQERGTEIHFAIEKYINMRYDSVLKDEYQGYYEQFKLFADKYGITQDNAVCEVMGFNSVFNFAGTMDIIYKKGNDFYLIDIKTSSVASPKVWALQLSGYEMIAREHGIDFKDRFVLQLGKESYKMHQMPIVRNEFMSAWLLYSYFGGKKK
jgi:hypothetical protein